MGTFGFRSVLDEKRLDAAGAQRRLVVLEVQLGRVTQMNPFAEETADAAFGVLQFLDLLLRFLLFEAADVHAREVEIGTDVDFRDRHQTERRRFQIVTEYLDQRVADHRSDLARSARLLHVSVAISSNSSFSLVQPARTASVFVSTNEWILSRSASAVGPSPVTNATAMRAR